MLILNEHNQILDTNKISKSCMYSVLRFKDPKDPDFFMEELTYIEEFTSYTMEMQIGPHVMYVPSHWSILCSDFEYVQSMPLNDVAGKDFNIFCINPLDGFIPHYPTIRVLNFHSNTTWSAPPIQDKDMLVVPIGDQPSTNGVAKGPLCAMLTPHKLDINRPISDII